MLYQNKITKKAEDPIEKNSANEALIQYLVYQHYEAKVRFKAFKGARS